MADAAPTGNENHGGGANLGHEQRVVVSAADHFLQRQTKLGTDARHGIDQLRIANRWRIDVNAFDSKPDVSLTANLAN